MSVDRSSDDHAPSGGEISVLHLVGILLKWRYTVLTVTLGVAFLVVGVRALSYEPTYTSQASFLPQGAQRSGGGFESMAGQLGITLPSNEGSESPQFYAELLRSREILRRLLEDTFTVSSPAGDEAVGRAGTLLDLLELEGPSEAVRVEAGLRWLAGAVTTNVLRETSMVRVSVTTPWPGISWEIGERLMELANDFNLRIRQSRASAERGFIEERLVEAREELNGAENDLKRFLENNRQFQNSPELLFERDRLQRVVDTRQQVFATLSESYEQSRIAEVRNTPVITVVEPPNEPVQRNPRGLLSRGILGLVLGGLFGVFIAFGREVVGRRRLDRDPDYEAFSEIWADTLDDLRGLIRRPFGKRG